LTGRDLTGAFCLPAVAAAGEDPRAAADRSARGSVAMRALARLALAALAIIAVMALWQSSDPALGAPVAGFPDAPPRLSETGLYTPGQQDRIDARNRPFAPQYPLWSDGARK